jgi:hypothetical protein
MKQRVLDELVFRLRDGNMRGLPAPVLLLGAGASVGAGVPLLRELARHFGFRSTQRFQSYVASLGPRRRFLRLSEFLQSRDPLRVTAGYRALAALVADRYFDVIFSTNVDPMLEDALSAARLRRRDYLLVINGMMRTERLEPLFSAETPRVKVVKLHGDVFHRFMAWTPAEMEEYVGEMVPLLELAVQGRDLVVVGHSLADSPRISGIAREVLEGGGRFWYVNLKRPPAPFREHPSTAMLKAKSEEFFPRLAETLGVEWAPEPEAPGRREGARTVDDLMASVVGIAGPSGPSVCTGFLLAEPRLIVTDAWSVGGTVQVVTSGGRRLAARPLRRIRTHPFGPLLLEAPAEWDAPGLLLSAEPPTDGTAVRVAVAAGERVGVSSGAIPESTEKTVPVAPVGPVPHLVSIACAVAPGSSGAPVVDSSFAVRGFIVAGSDDWKKPWSEMYPAARWAGAVVGRRRR